MPMGQRLKESELAPLQAAVAKESMLPIIRLSLRDSLKASDSRQEDVCLEVDVIALEGGPIDYGATSRYAPVHPVSRRVYSQFLDDSNWKFEGVPSGRHGLVDVASLIGKRVCQVGRHWPQVTLHTVKFYVTNVFIKYAGAGTALHRCMLTTLPHTDEATRDTSWS